jgi:excisionase family DNA binding protein
MVRSQRSDESEQPPHDKEALLVAIPRLLTIDEVSTIARAPASSVSFWIYSGRLRALKVGRRRLIAENDLLEFLGLDREALPNVKQRRR